MTAAPLPPGTRIRDHVIEQFIASGGFGNVYRVHDTANDRQAALKILHPELCSLGDSFARFLREAQVLERIRHPNIIEVFDSGTLLDGSAYMVMELLSGHDLGAHIARHGTLSIDSALDILDPVCDALAHAHERGVIHRDVKASNVFLAESDGHQRVVLLDFGLAKLIEQGSLELTTSRVTIGTPSSMSPEQIRGEAVDARSDVYGLAALTYHMLTGKLPFAGTSQTVMQYMHLHGQRPRVSSMANVSAAVDEVVSRAMAPSREARPAGPLELLVLLREAAYSSLPRQRRARPTERAAIAVHVDVRVTAGAGRGNDDDVLDEMDTVLETAEAHLGRSEFQIGLEGSSSTLYVRPLGSAPERERRDAVLAALELHRELERRLAAPRRVHVNLCLHMDMALVRDGRVQGGDIMRLERWAPEAEVAGVVGAAEIFDGLGFSTEPVAGHAGLRRVVPSRPAELASLSGEQSRERVMHSQMMAQIGRQVAGIIHDLRSPLNVVLGNIEEVLARLEDGESFADDDLLALRSAQTAALQIQSITTSILGASAVKAYGNAQCRVSVRKLIANAVALSHSETRRKARVEVTHQGDSYVMGSPGRLTQVLVNLLVNAAQAIDGHGRIEIHTQATDDGVVQIAIRDTGAGMSVEVQQRIFEPFFTTKAVDTGTGLGLALVREIVEEHSGTIAVSSTPGAGSCFTICLPAA